MIKHGYRIEVVAGRKDLIGRSFRYFWWRVVSKNNQTIATSETYTRKASAMKAARNFRDYGFVIPIHDNTNGRTDRGSR